RERRSAAAARRAPSRTPRPATHPDAGSCKRRASSSRRGAPRRRRSPGRRGDACAGRRLRGCALMYASAVPGVLANRVAFVTGGASGLGRAIALRFADEGAFVVVGDVRDEPREGGATTAELLGGRGIFRTADAADAGDLDALVETALGRTGRLDVMVCNAGISGRHSKPLLETSE